MIETVERISVNAAGSYEWKKFAQIPVSATVAAHALRSIYDSNGGFISPRLVVQESKEPTAPLHKCFTWNDTAAGQAYREHQASHILRSLVVVHTKVVDAETRTVPTRAYVSLVASKEFNEDGGEVNDRSQPPRAYIPVTTVMGQEDLRRQYVQQAFGELMQWRKRYQDISELASLFEEIDRVSDRLGSVG